MLLRNGYGVEKDAGQQVHFIVDKDKSEWLDEVEASEGRHAGMQAHRGHASRSGRAVVMHPADPGALSEEGDKLKKTASGDEEPSVWDLSLVRRKEVSRAGRMLHSNAINGQEALTLLVRSVPAAPSRSCA